MKRIFMITLIALLVGGVGGVHAYTVNHTPGTDVFFQDLTTMVTTGDTMGGMRVTVGFTNGGHQSVSWAGAGDGQTGQASGAGWSLSLSGNSWYAPWVLDASVAIDSISINALSGEAVFDVLWPDEGTPNSDIGWNYDPYGYETVDVTATYSNRGLVTGNAWGGDLYANLGIVFNAEAGFSGHYEFYTDTDNVVVPIPATILLLGGGLIGLAGWRKRKAS
ncbi:MAG: VPLPA-CTERM sorting domain-containing protein [Desulfobacterales bacterium]|nr:VPLPA-CTERM sorting domain-containing protein [Desulfobacterales bacterium]